MKFIFCNINPMINKNMANAQRGQALTEFVVLAVAIVPLFLVLPIIAKYQDIAHSTQMASRYVAFEATTRNEGYGSWKPVDQLAGEVRRRFFSNPNAPIKTNDTAGDFKAHQNLFWRDPKGDSLLPQLNDNVVLSFGSNNSSDHGGAFTSASDGQPFALKKNLSLAANGIYTANVKVKIANMPEGLMFYEPLDQINLAMQRSTSIVIDGWSGRNPTSVQAKLDDPLIFPGRLLEPLVAPIDYTIEKLFLEVRGSGIKSPQLGKLDFWKDVVPKDRLRAK